VNVLFVVWCKKTIVNRQFFHLSLGTIHHLIFGIKAFWSVNMKMTLIFILLSKMIPRSKIYDMGKPRSLSNHNYIKMKK